MSGSRCRGSMRGLALESAPVAKKMVAAFLVVVALISIVAFLSRDEGGPIPPPASLANYGLAVWPEDTLEEAVENVQIGNPGGQMHGRLPAASGGRC
jgi:hypothetical protein